MINALLHRQPVVVNRNEHLSLRMRMPVTDWSLASKMNGVFIAATEFGDAARDYPIVFVDAGVQDDGKRDIAPVAILGMVKEDNLFVEGTAWRGNYIPSVLAMYPFAIARLDAERFTICFDAGWAGLSGTEGDPLFTPQGEFSPFLTNVQQQLERMEGQIQRTRLMCGKLRELDLLQEMRFDATMPDGTKFAVDGFLTVDENRLKALSDTAVLDIHHSGVLGLIHAHYVSLGNMRKLLDWHIARHQKPVA